MRKANRTIPLPNSLINNPMTQDEWAIVRAFQSDPERLLLIVRFWAKVNIRGEDECWEWRDRPVSRPSFSWDGFSYVAARVAYEISKGPLPPEHFACHTCDNGHCVNPKHLFAGTDRENKADFDRKGLRPKGDAHYRAKFTVDQVRDIRRRYATGLANQEELAREFGVIQETIGQIVRRQTWKHVEDFVPTSGECVTTESL